MIIWTIFAGGTVESHRLERNFCRLEHLLLYSIYETKKDSSKKMAWLWSFVADNRGPLQLKAIKYCLLYRNEKAMVKRDSDFWLSWLVYDGINVLIRISVKKSPNICNLFPKSYVKFRQKIRNLIFATQILCINGLTARLLLSLVQKTRVCDT